MGNGADPGFGSGHFSQIGLAANWSDIVNMTSEWCRNNRFNRLKYICLNENDSFWLSLNRGSTAFIATTTGTEAGSSRRDNIGLGLGGNVGPFSTSLSGVFQGGQFRPAQERQPTRAVRAYAVNASLLYNRTDLPTKPSVSFQADLFSGGSYKSKDGSVGTFASPYFPLLYYNGVMSSVTSQNLIGVGPLATFSLRSNIHFKLHVPFFWRESTQDSVYCTGKIYSWRNGLSGGFIEAALQTRLAWNFVLHSTWKHDIVGFIASRSMRAAGAESDAFYMQTLEFKF